MTELPRLNGIIRALEQGQAAFAAFTPAEIDAAVAFAEAGTLEPVADLERFVTMESVVQEAPG